MVVRDTRALRSKGLLLQHQRLLRLKRETKLDERSMRLEALKASDFTAYQVRNESERGAGDAVPAH